jgi:CheY-like chemotaxis protein
MGTETILLVEAQPADVAVTSASLERAGYTVLVAGNYDSALGIFDQHRDDIDFLVTDISLPGNNGCELAKNILNLKPDTRVLLVSCHTAAEVSLFCGLSLSDVHFLQKPFKPLDLLLRLCRVRLSSDWPAAKAWLRRWF